MFEASTVETQPNLPPHHVQIFPPHLAGDGVIFGEKGALVRRGSLFSALSSSNVRPIPTLICQVLRHGLGAAIPSQQTRDFQSCAYCFMERGPRTRLGASGIRTIRHVKLGIT